MMYPSKSAARLALAACLSFLAPVGAAQETQPVPAPAPAPEPQPETPAPTQAPGQPDQPKPAPIVPAKPIAPQPKPATPGDAAPAPDAGASAEVPEGRKLFLAAADVVKKAQAITYRAKTYGVGQMLAMYTAKTQADVRMLRTPAGWLTRSTGSGGSFSLKDGTEFDMAWLGAHTEWVDHEAKKVVEKNAHETKGNAVQLAPNDKVEEFSEPNPFSAEIAAPDYVIETQHEQGGVNCDVILVINGRIKMRWMLGVEDHLPRWKERIIEGNAAAGSMITEISNIVVDASNPPRMTPEMLRITVPEGYTEDRVPSTPAPAPTPEKAPAVPVPTTSPVTTPPAETGPPVPAAPVVRKAPDFDLKDAKGAAVSLASLKGNVVVLEFAGTWCLPLRDAHPELDALTKDYSKQPVKVYMLDVREKSSASAIDDLAKGGYTFGLLLNADPVARSYDIKTYPSYAIVDKEGNLKRVEGNYTRIDTLNKVRDAVNEATGGQGAPKPEGAKADEKPAAIPPAPDPKAPAPTKK